MVGGEQHWAEVGWWVRNGGRNGVGNAGSWRVGYSRRAALRNGRRTLTIQSLLALAMISRSSQKNAESDRLICNDRGRSTAVHIHTETHTRHHTHAHVITHTHTSSHTRTHTRTRYHTHTHVTTHTHTLSHTRTRYHTHVRSGRSAPENVRHPLLHTPSSQTDTRMRVTV